MMAGIFHTPVMVDEVLNFLNPGPGQTLGDCTLGGGGHAEAVLSWSGPGRERIGLLIGIDRDPVALEKSSARLSGFGERVRVRRGRFSDLPTILDEEGVGPIDGILADLGVSFTQLTDPARGFSLRAEGPLDMRMDQSAGQSAAGLLAGIEERELARLIREYGEEPLAKRIARAVVSRREEGRPAKDTAELAALIESAAGGRKGAKIHPATRTFMALRIHLNRELEELESLLASAPGLLKPGGRLVVISYHSLEDRLVKRAIARGAKGCVCPPEQPVCTCSEKPVWRPLTKKPVEASEDEIRLNPAARSAKLRAAARI